MPSVCFYFQVHQPYRIRRYGVFDIGEKHDYFDEEEKPELSNRKILRKVIDKSYLPTNAILLDLLKKYPGFKVSFSLSGTVIDQFEKYAPEVVDSFRALVDTGRTEILDETYYHSLAFLYSRDEFSKQVEMHRQKVIDLFRTRPRVFRNTELIYTNDLAHVVEAMGYDGILMEGADSILEWRSPNFIHSPKGAERIKLLLKNYRLSDDVAFRFSTPGWQEHPLIAPKFAQWISEHNGNGQLINLFMDYETFGEHQWECTGIFNFLKALPGEVLKHADNDFITPSEAIDRYDSVGELDIPHYVSWADEERDLSAWLSNSMQNDAIKKLYELETIIINSGDADLIEDWRRLQTSDHFYYMCTKWFNDGDVHKYFNPYESPYEAYIHFMNALNDLRLRLGSSNTEANTSPRSGYMPMPEFVR